MYPQDPSPLPYGGLHYYQMHYIVQVEDEENWKFLARCTRITKGRFANKQVVGVKWTSAGDLANVLQSDDKLTEMLKKAMLHEDEIRVDPQDDHIRIHGRWIHEDKFGFNATMFEIADRIAMHIRRMLEKSGKKP